MSDIKEVRVAMSEADVKAFSRGTTRRRRVKRTEGESPASMGGMMVEKGAADIASLPAPIAPISQPTVIPSVATTPQVTQVTQAPQTTQAPVAPQMAGTSIVGGAIAPQAIVKIQAKKTSGGMPTYAPSVTTGPKILLTKKRISAAPAAHTLKKPRLVIAAGGMVGAPLPKNSTPSSETETAKQGVMAGGMKKKRRFTERRISIEVKSAATTRKHRNKLTHKIDAMPIASVRKLLLRKGVLKPKAEGKMPPEAMMRSMLKDYLLLHTAD
jgi:hypothetical protein